MDEIFDLDKKNCIPCKRDIPPFDISEIHKYLKKIDGWDVKKFNYYSINGANVAFLLRFSIVEI